MAETAADVAEPEGAEEAATDVVVSPAPADCVRRNPAATGPTERPPDGTAVEEASEQQSAETLESAEILGPVDSGTAADLQPLVRHYILAQELTLLLRKAHERDQRPASVVPTVVHQWRCEEDAMSEVDEEDGFGTTLWSEMAIKPVEPPVDEASPEQQSSPALIMAEVMSVSEIPSWCCTTRSVHCGAQPDGQPLFSAAFPDTTMKSRLFVLQEAMTEEATAVLEEGEPGTEVQRLGPQTGTAQDLGMGEAVDVKNLASHLCSEPLGAQLTAWGVSEDTDTETIKQQHQQLLQEAENTAASQDMQVDPGMESREDAEPSSQLEDVSPGLLVGGEDMDRGEAVEMDSKPGGADPEKVPEPVLAEERTVKEREGLLDKGGCKLDSVWGAEERAAAANIPAEDVVTQQARPEAQRRAFGEEREGLFQPSPPQQPIPISTAALDEAEQQEYLQREPTPPGWYNRSEPTRSLSVKLSNLIQEAVSAPRLSSCDCGIEGPLLPVESIKVKQPGRSKPVKVALRALPQVQKPVMPATLLEPSGPAVETAGEIKALPPELHWADTFDFSVPDEVQPPMPLPHRKGCRSVTGGKVVASSRLDNQHRAQGLLPGGFVDRGPDRGPLQVRATCTLSLPPRAPVPAEDPASGDNTDVPRSSRSSLSEGRSSSSSSPSRRTTRRSFGSQAASQATTDEAEYEGLARWLRSEDFFSPTTPREGLVHTASTSCPDELPDWTHSPTRDKSQAQDNQGEKKKDEWGRGASKGERLVQSPVGTLPLSSPLVGRGGVKRGEAGSPVSLSPGDSAEATVPFRKTRVPHPGMDQRRSWPYRTLAPFPGSKGDLGESFLEAPSVYNFLRSQFADIDVKNRRLLEQEDVVGYICGRLHQGERQLPEDLDNLLQETARRCFRQALVQSRGLRVEDWVHFGLMLGSAPSHLAHDLLNRRLKKELEWRPLLLRQLLEAFAEADVRGAGVLRPADLREAFEAGDGMIQELSVCEEDPISYYDFLAYCLGCRRTPIVLNWYDVSYGYAQWFPSQALGGEPLDGIWHTGVVAFGREYWYGGKVFSSDPGHAPFPPGPIRSTQIGYTLRSREELEDFLRFEMVPRYTRENYDVMRHNCNHFSEEVASFLVQGSHIPEEALMQPETFMRASIFEKFRPYLNTWLSGFETSGGDAGIDDLITEWRARLWPGDLALYVPVLDHHEPAKLVQVSQVDNWAGTCDITYFETRTAPADGAAPGGCVCSRDAEAMRWCSCAFSGSFWDWQVVRRQAVQISLLRPHTVCGRGHAGTAGSGLCGSVRAQLKNTNPDVQVHLRRKGMVYAHCPQGHFMATCSRRRVWGWSSGPCCGICGKAVSSGEGALECSLCNFYICGPCDHKGLFRGYYSLGCIDVGMAKLLVEDMQWVRYKARRYMAASGAVNGILELDSWLKRVAPRLYGDLGLDLPSTVELIQVYRLGTRARAARNDHCRQCNHGPDGAPGRFVGLSEEEFCDLLFELLALLAVGSAGIVSL